MVEAERGQGGEGRRYSQSRKGLSECPLCDLNFSPATREPLAGCAQWVLA